MWNSTTFLQGAKEHLSNITWENEFANLDVNKSWDRLKHILKYIEDNYVPKRAVKRYCKPIDNQCYPYI